MGLANVALTRVLQRDTMQNLAPRPRTRPRDARQERPAPSEKPTLSLRCRPERLRDERQAAVHRVHLELAALDVLDEPHALGARVEHVDRRLPQRGGAARERLGGAVQLLAPVAQRLSRRLALASPWLRRLLTSTNRTYFNYEIHQLFDPPQTEPLPFAGEAD